MIYAKKERKKKEERKKRTKRNYRVSLTKLYMFETGSERGKSGLGIQLVRTGISQKPVFAVKIYATRPNDQ